MTELEKQQQEILRSIEDRIEELKNVKQTLLKCRKDIECMEVELSMVRSHNDHLTVTLRDCANELCLKCGNYREAHLGACNDCRWLEVKHIDVR